MKFEKTEVFNFEGAIRGMRDPKESWDKSDSINCDTYNINNCEKCLMNDKCINYSYHFYIGEKDLELMQTLIRAGSEHRKFMRQIFVSVDITAPLYWWKEFDTYKIGTVANSTSTMHKLASTPITMDCFEKCNEGEELNDSFFVEHWLFTIATLEKLRQKYNETKNKRYWKELIRLLPESWLQTRTVTMNYENLLNMCSKGQRRFHKLTEWSESFINWARSLPYAQELIFIDEVGLSKDEQIEEAVNRG